MSREGERMPRHLAERTRNTRRSAELIKQLQFLFFYFFLTSPVVGVKRYSVDMSLSASPPRGCRSVKGSFDLHVAATLDTSEKHSRQSQRDRESCPCPRHGGAAAPTRLP